MLVADSIVNIIIDVDHVYTIMSSTPRKFTMHSDFQETLGVTRILVRRPLSPLVSIRK